MACGRRREHWAFMDSRGNGVFEEIVKLDRDEFIGVWKQPGATLEELVQLASKHLDSYPFDIVYVAGGVNNITTKNKVTGKVSFDWDPPELLIPSLLQRLAVADEQLAKNFPASKIVFCPLVGSDLMRVVNAHKITTYQQDVTDAAVFDL